MIEFTVSTKIPKKLFMLWLGDHVPEYAGFSARAFQQVNPDFQLFFIHYTIQQLRDIQNGQLEDNALKRALDRTIMCDDPYAKWQRDFYGYQPSFLQLLADIARVEILNQHGGIYVDCDAFPIVPFDDTLLSHDFFCVKRRSGAGMGCFLDNFFLGKSSDSQRIEDPYNVNECFLVDHTIRSEAMPAYYLLRKKFISGQLQVGEHALPDHCYVDHYNIRTWMKPQMQLQERWFDKLWRK